VAAAALGPSTFWARGTFLLFLLLLIHSTFGSGSDLLRKKRNHCTLLLQGVNAFLRIQNFFVKLAATPNGPVYRDYISFLPDRLRVWACIRNKSFRIHITGSWQHYAEDLNDGCYPCTYTLYIVQEARAGP
jgi:hypothetical protein